ncbi:hypothetical protein BH09VER1_BH09VER1_14630 [soil metagenome]
MNEKIISRQHETTTLEELEGKLCSEFLVVYDAKLKKYGCCYMNVEGVFHRFYLDAGLLFWRSHRSPDPENDLGEGDCYVDFGKKFKVAGINVVNISMGNCRLDIRFENGVEILLKNEVQGIGAELGVSAEDDLK